MSTKPKVVVAGASGFVGRHLLQALKWDYQIRALSRSPRESFEVDWQACDLFSLKDSRRALRGMDYAFYLVHSMMPSARLTQGRFEDFDLICADNFARAAAAEGVKQIIYLGGLVPETRPLSRHLSSRLEVEETLGAYRVPVTTLRAGMVVGPGGSSFRILVNLVRRLPVMLLPKWTQTKTQPIYIEDVVEALRACIGDSKSFGVSHDLGGPDQMTYGEMIRRTGKLLGKNPLCFRVPLFSPGLSKLWVSLITESSRELVGPLVESLRHPMIAKSTKWQEEVGIRAKTFDSSVRLSTARSPLEVPKSTHRNREESDVRSVQRLSKPQALNAEAVAKEYMKWLSGRFFGLCRVVISDEKVCSFKLPFISKPLLVLERDPKFSSPGRQLFRIRGGLLARAQGRGRLEFREVLGGKYILSAIHEFKPRLPWLVYTCTQALVHLLTMRLFARHLKSLNGSKS